VLDSKVRDQRVEERQSTPPLLRRALARGVTPYLLVLDVTAWTLGTATVGQFDWLHVAFLLVMTTLLAAGGAYKSRLSLYVLEDGARLISRTVVAAALVASTDLSAGRNGDHGLLLRTAAVVAFALCLLRAVGYATVRRRSARGLVTHRTLVLGAGRVGVQIVDCCTSTRVRLRPVGFLDHERSSLLTSPRRSRRRRPARGDDRRGGHRGHHRRLRWLAGHALVEVIRTCDRLDARSSSCRGCTSCTPPRPAWTRSGACR
jgi:hypothetical protein